MKHNALYDYAVTFLTYMYLDYHTCMLFLSEFFLCNLGKKHCIIHDQNTKNVLLKPFEADYKSLSHHNEDAAIKRY